MHLSSAGPSAIRSGRHVPRSRPRARLDNRCAGVNKDNIERQPTYRISKFSRFSYFNRSLAFLRRPAAGLVRDRRVPCRAAGRIDSSRGCPSRCRVVSSCPTRSGQSASISLLLLLNTTRTRSFAWTTKTRFWGEKGQQPERPTRQGTGEGNKAPGRGTCWVRAQQRPT